MYLQAGSGAVDSELPHWLTRVSGAVVATDARCPSPVSKFFCWAVNVEALRVSARLSFACLLQFDVPMSPGTEAQLTPDELIEVFLADQASRPHRTPEPAAEHVRRRSAFRRFIGNLFR